MRRGQGEPGYGGEEELRAARPDLTFSTPPSCARS
jgi:hypothetical protein